MISDTFTASTKRRVSMSGARTLLAGCAFFLVSSQASAVMLDFNGQTPSTNFGTISESGYTITGSGPGNHYVSSGGSSFCSPACPQNGTNYLLSQDDIFTIAESGGNTFNLSAFDGAEAHQGVQSLWAERIRVEGFLSGGGSVAHEFTLDWIQDGDGPANDFQTFDFSGLGFNNLTSVAFSGVGVNSADWFSIDNIAINTGAVPEPATLGLFMVGLAGAAAYRRKSAR